MPHDATVAVPTAISDRDAHLDRAADAEVVVTAIDAEARAVPHEHEWTDWAAPFEGYQWFQCRTCCCGAREYRKVIARPDTAIWHEGNDWDEQVER